MTTNLPNNHPKDNLWTKVETHWSALAWLLFLMAILLRIINLSGIPLTEKGSNLALIAAQIATRRPDLTSELPIYTGITSVLFFVFGNSEFWSRIFPIITGSSLVFIPGMWRDILDGKRRILLSLMLTLIPAISYYSRTIDSPIFATAAILWSISLLKSRQWKWAGVFTACLWISGSFALPLTLLAVLGFLALRSNEQNYSARNLDLNIQKAELLKLCASHVVTLVIVSTSFFLNPAGLGNIGTFFTTAYSVFKGWQPDDLIRFAFVVLRYAFPAFLIFLLIRFRSGKNNVLFLTQSRMMLMVATICLLLSIGNVGFLLPFSIATWFTAILMLVRTESTVGQKHTVYFPLVVFGIALLVYTSIVAHTWVNATYNSIALGLATIAGVMLFALAHGFVALGWSSSIAKNAVVTSLAVVLLASSLSVTFSSILTKPEHSALHWESTPIYVDSELKPLLLEFQKSANFEAGELSVAVDVNPDGPDRWVLRDFSNDLYLGAGGVPQLIISPSSQPGLAIETRYRGMTLSGFHKIDWLTVNLKQFIAGLLGSDMPTISNQHYLWVEKTFFSGK